MHGHFYRPVDCGFIPLPPRKRAAGGAEDRLPLTPSRDAVLFAGRHSPYRPYRHAVFSSATAARRSASSSSEKPSTTVAGGQVSGCSI